MAPIESHSPPDSVQLERHPENDLDRGIVGWEGQHDPLNPRNFTMARKLTALGLVSAISFLSSLASSIPAPGVNEIMRSFGTSSHILGSLATSIYVLGLAIGPLLLSPLSEIYGRRPVLNLANLWLTVWQIGCALANNMTTLIICRFLAGTGGSACLTIGGGVISDSFSVERRGLANAVFTIGPIFGPVLGPILGGFISQRTNWRWVFWVLLIACSVATAITAAAYRETSHSVLLRRKTQELRKATGREDLISYYDNHSNFRAISEWKTLAQAIQRPVRFLFKSPVIPLLAIYMSFVFGLLYLLLTTVTNVFRETNGWDLELCGLANLGLGLGFTIGLITVAKTSDKTIIKLTERNKGIYKAEMRLFTCIVFAFFIPISFFWYGWATEKRSHWIVQILGLAPFGFGIMGIFAPIQTYFIDIGGPYAASVLAALTTTRCTVGAFLPLAGPSMYASLGLGWGNSLLGFIAFGLLPAPMLIYAFGGNLRERFPIHVPTVKDGAEV